MDCENDKFSNRVTKEEKVDEIKLEIVECKLFNKALKVQSVDVDDLLWYFVSGVSLDFDFLPCQLIKPKQYSY